MPNEVESILLELDVTDDKCTFPSSIESAFVDANAELQNLGNKLTETTESICQLTIDCDKLDYILVASSGALCGILDVFFVGKPDESPLGNISDAWFGDRTIDFAKLCGYSGDEKNLSSAILFLETKFQIPYDQSIGGAVVKELLELTPRNHHFKSLGHNPTFIGHFFSIMNQFTNTSSFVANGQLITK